MNIKITGIGSFIPSKSVRNEDFAHHEFLNQDGSPFGYPIQTVIRKFKGITGIGARRYANEEHNTSDLAFFASEKAIAHAGIDPETLDYIMLAHNFGDVSSNSTQADIIPSLATRVKHKLGIKNPKCVAYDILFGCPGWVEGMMQANAFIKSGMGKRVLVIGAETLSRVVDPFDRDTMIYADGAGAAVVEASDDETGMLAHDSATFALEEANFLFFGKSYQAKYRPKTKFIKMYGRKIYEFALTNVPLAMKNCLDSSGIDIKDVKKVLIHQANEKMDEAIIDRFYKLYGQSAPEGIMPMSIHELGNSSVATVPTLFDLLVRGEIEGHSVEKGDILLFASVGAGMNINAFVYRY